MIDEASKILEDHLQKVAQLEQGCGMDCPLEEKILVFEKYKSLFASGTAQVGIRPEKFNWEEIKTYSPKLPRYVVYSALILTIAFCFTPLWYVSFITFGIGIYATYYSYTAFIKKVKEAITQDYCPFEKWYDEKKFAILIDNQHFIAYPTHWVHALYKYLKS